MSGSTLPIAIAFVLSIGVFAATTAWLIRQQ